MRLIPSEIPLNAPSSGEIGLHKLLKDVPLDDWVALYFEHLLKELKNLPESNFLHPRETS